MKPTPQPKPVTCATCRHFVRDTSGPSYNTDEYLDAVEEALRQQVTNQLTQ